MGGGGEELDGGGGATRGERWQRCRQERRSSAAENTNEKWDQAAGKSGEMQVAEGPEDQSSQPDSNANSGKQGTAETQIPVNPLAQNRIACENCGLFNHVTKDCRRILCETCGYSNHSTYDCK